MNVFDYINNYIDNAHTGQYGDLLNNSKENKIEQFLDSNEKELYNEIKQRDKRRLLYKTNNNNPIYTNILNNRTPSHTAGIIGGAQQIC